MMKPHRQLDLYLGWLLIEKIQGIAIYLNANNIETHVQYKERQDKKWNYPRNYEIKQWSGSAVMIILFNKIYTGTIIYEKTACNAQIEYNFGIY